MPRDVRMRGFARRADVEEVLHFLAAPARAKPLPAEAVPLLAAGGRVLARDVQALHPVPGFARAAMDGYALRGEATFGASAADPLPFALLGESLPGRPFAGECTPGGAVRIMTGAPMPAGADAVAPAEVCSESASAKEVQVRAPTPPQKHVGAAGEDIRAGALVLRAGRRLRPQDAGLLASIGAAEVHCIRRPRVQLIITGNELLPAGSAPEGAQIVDSNSVVLRGLIARDGGETLPFNILPDDETVIINSLQNAARDADCILVSGGSSVGREDHAPRLLSQLGALHFHGVAMRPSSPAGVGEIKGCLVFLLPGNPVSCLCAYEFFAGPHIRALGGRPRAWPHRRARLPLARKITSQLGRTDYVRCAVESGGVAPIATSGASILSSLVRADGAVIVPRGREGIPPGETVELFLYDDDAPEIITGAAQ